MGEVLHEKIIPELIRLHPVSPEQKKRMEECPDEPLFTLVFDREIYSPARLAQENFFRYMRQEYAIDKIIQYSVDDIYNDISVVNLEYNNINSKIKKERETLCRGKAKFYEHEQQNPIQLTEKENQKWMKITLYPLANQRSNEAVGKICDTINNTETIFPCTNLMLNFKIATTKCEPSQEF